MNKAVWEQISQFIIKKRVFVLICIVFVTGLLITQWKYNKFTFTEVNLIPQHHQINLDYDRFKEIFGDEGNLVVIGIKDSLLFTPDNFHAWQKLNKQLREMQELISVISLDNLQVLHKDKATEKFVIKSFLANDSIYNQEQITALKNKLVNKLPFYKGLVYNQNAKTIRSLLFMDKEIVNTNLRRDFIFNKFKPLIHDFEMQTGLEVHISGMPYIRTVNTKMILNEVVLFVILSLLVTSLIFYFFFRSFRATFISVLVVCIAVMWGIGIVGFLRYKITILTALVPPLIIVIGIPNCIFLINKYQQGIRSHGNKDKSLINVISKVGNATLMTNLTTAAGFGTFVITDSVPLQQFGIVAFLNIMGIFVLTITIIPIVYSCMAPPKNKHLKHLKKKWINDYVDWMERLIRNHRSKIYIVSIVIVILGIIGSSNVTMSGSLLDDIPEDKKFAKDIRFFENEFEGILPLEIMIDTKRKNGAMKIYNLRKVEKLQQLIREMPELSEPISVSNVVKYLKQTYYNDNPKYYQLPTSQESSFIMSYARGTSDESINFLDDFVDKDKQIIRITSTMKDVGIDRIEEIEASLNELIKKIFPKEKYNVVITGNPIVFTKGTPFLVKNLFISLMLAIVFISMLMALLFRLFGIIVISLITNLIPLVFIGGMMGILGIPLKPSTILIFSIAFGISVDDTLHFLARYRQELKRQKSMKKAVYSAFEETSLSMFYTSVVLLLGFSVFTVSNFGGTVALGGLISMTLLCAMFSNLLLLPSLLLSFEKKKKIIN